MAEIRMTNGNLVLVDDDDFRYLKHFTWSEHQGRQTTYAKCGRVWMHRVIVDAPAGMVVDHKNNNGLDNRRENLRVCTIAQNSRNVPKRNGHGSLFKGVQLCIDKPRNKPWRAMLRTRQNGKVISISLGYFCTEDEAALAYDSAAIAVFGEYARTNFTREHHRY